MDKPHETFGVLILAAGKGTRMKSKTPKVLHLMLEEPILFYPLAAAQGAGFEDIAVVAGFGGDEVAAWTHENFPKAQVIFQTEQRGTGHAAMVAREWWRNFDNVIILPGDAPMIRAKTLADLAARHVEGRCACSFLSFELADPTGYGRVVRIDDCVSIVEQRDATEAQREIKEVNSGMYVFSTKELDAVIDSIKCANAQGEYYLPDALPRIALRGGKVEAFKAADPDEFRGINDQVQLSEAARLMRDRIVRAFMLERGMHCMDPSSVWIGPRVVMGNDVTLHPNVQLWGRTVVEDDAFIGSFSVLRNSTVRAKAVLKGDVRLNDSTIGPRASAGPFAFMREGAELLENAHMGRYVEIKKSRIGVDAKVPHLSYIGDTEIGENTNIGAGTITCNYDGVRKNATKIGRDCLIGSNTMFVAPVTVGDEVSTAAGSVITQDVPDGALGVGRSRQINIKGWSTKTRKKNSKQ